MENKKTYYTVGIIVQSISILSKHDFFDRLSYKFSERDCRSIIQTTGGNIEVERECFEHFSKIADAIVVISSATNYSEISDVVPIDKPVVFLFTEPEGCDRTCILESDYSAVYQGIISCSNLGKKKIAFVYSSFDNTHTQECLRSYKDALAVIGEDVFDESLLFAVENPHRYDPSILINQIMTTGCEAILTTTPTLTSTLIDCIIYSSKIYDTSKLLIMGYEPTQSLITSQMYVDLIVQPTDEIIDLTVQQILFLINHPKIVADKKRRVYRLKSTLRMHHKTLS